MAHVELNGISKSFGSVCIIPELNLEIASGEFVALVGPSGCGKSTVLRMIAGLEDPSHGTIKIDGQVVNDRSPRDRGIAMVFQNYALYPHMSVRQNLEFSLKLAGLSTKEIVSRVQEASEILGLSELLARKPSQLSGGQKQRVAMGRALVRRPKVLLFDEPLSNLDAQLRSKVRAEIAQIHKKFRSTMIYVTHDQVEAMTLADRIAVLNRGNLDQFGTPMEVYHQPRSQFVAGFIGSPAMNFIPTKLLPASGFPDNAKVSGVRPESIQVFSGTGNKGKFKVGTGKITLIEPLGSTTYIHIKTIENQTLVAEHREQSQFVLDQDVEVWSEPANFFHFTEDGKSLRE